MKKENLLYLVIILLVFISGFLIGDKMNETGRYETKELTYTTDTKKGVIYVLSRDTFTTFNLKTGEKKVTSYKK